MAQCCFAWPQRFEKGQNALETRYMAKLLVLWPCQNCRHGPDHDSHTTGSEVDG